MKNIYFLSIISFLSIGIANAQAKISLGLKGGLNIPNLRMNSSNPVIDGFKTYASGYYGIVLENGLSERWSLLNEVNYSTVGITKNGNQVIPRSAYKNLKIGLNSFKNLYADFYSKVNVNYVEVPLMLKYYVYQDENWNFFINGGPFMSVMTKSSVKTDGYDYVYTDAKHTNKLFDIKLILTQEQDLMDRLEPVDFGFKGGFGATLKGDIGELFIAASANLGLLNMQTDPGDGANKTRAATISIGYLFHISQKKTDND